MHLISQISIRIVSALFTAAIATTAFAEPVFTYQGVVELNGSAPANVFVVYELYRTETGGTPIAFTIAGTIFPDENGQFVSELDFGETGGDGLAIYNGDVLYLQVILGNVVQTPRQRITPTPIALSMPGAFSINNELRLGESMSRVKLGNGSVNTGLTILSGDLSIVAPTNFAATIVSESTIGTWLTLGNNSAGGSPWAIISTGSANGEGAGSFVLSDQSVGIPRMVINSSGNVGFGVTDPQEALHINGSVRSKTVIIEGGADVAERYDIASPIGMETKPGMVVSIDPTNLGKLMISDIAYDRKVAGVISGADGVAPGLILGHDGTVADGETPVANVGRVWCYVDADEGGPVTAGDLLTTATTPGHAMRVDDQARSQGAVLGKAMSSLESGRGLVLVLVSLQ